MKPGVGKEPLVYEVVSLEPYAGLSALFDRLDSARAPIVVVFVPRQLVELRSLLTLRLVRRHAEALHLEVYLVCEDLRTRLLAQREGLRAVAGPHQLPRRIRRASRRPGAAPLLSFPYRGLPHLLAPVPAVFVGLALAIATYFLVPGATVRLRPIQRTIEETVVIEAATDAKTASTDAPAAPVRRIPARVIVRSFPLVERLEPSGVRREPATAATGQVLLLNRTNEQQLVQRGAEVIRPGGPVFLIVAPVELPGVQWSSARVGIVAKDLGPVGNLPAQSIDRFALADLNGRVSVVNEQPTTGGTDADRSFVTADDQIELRNRANATVAGGSVAALQRAREPGESIYPETIRSQIQDEAFSHEIGRVTNQVAITLTVAARAPAFEGRTVQELARRVLADRTGPGLEVVPGSFETRPLEAIDWDDDRVRFRVSTKATLRTAIDPAAIVRLIAGLSAEDATDQLQATLPLAARPEVDLFPWWQTTVPELDWRVRIEQ